MRTMNPTATRKRPRLAILVSHPIQYYAPLFRGLQGPGFVELRVVFFPDS
jgi:hypothetical protein